MHDEILNIDYHKKRVAIKALNKAETINEASKLLKIGERTLFRYMEVFKISFCKENKQYIAIEAEQKN